MTQVEASLYDHSYYSDHDALRRHLSAVERFDEPDTIDLEETEQNPEDISDEHVNSVMGQEIALATDDYTADSLKMYMREISRYKLLKAYQEVELAKRIEAGGDDGHVARNDLVNANIRLVVSIARRYKNQHGVPFLDLIQQGSIGLIRAAEKFDHRKGFKFSTYATWWIRQAVQRSLPEQGKTVRVPIHVFEDSRKLQKTRNELRQRLERDPTDEEILEESRLTKDQFKNANQSIMVQPKSLNAPLNEDGHEFGDFLEADNPGFDEDLHLTHQQARVRELMREHLNERERRVLELRFGFGGKEPYTLEELGKIFNLTRERVRQIEGQAFKKLAPHLIGVFAIEDIVGLGEKAA